MKYCLYLGSLYKEKVFCYETMKQEVCLLPVRCRGCNSVFDLWYDLQQDQEEGEVESVQNGDFKKLLTQSFCWHCRKVVSGELEGEEPFLDESDESQTELKFSLAYQ